MKTFCLKTLLVSALLLAASSVAQAQATRTWVSGTGDDANPCNRLAPCKTFAGAISKTAAGGIITVMDPGSYGAVSITKSLTIQAEGDFAGILTNVNNAIVVNAGAGDTVVLRNLHLDGLSAALNGVRFVAGLALYVENCTINRFTGKGIDFQPTANSALFVKDTVVRNNSFGSGGGIFIKPGAGGTATATIDNANLERNLKGLHVEGSSKVSVRDSVMTGNSQEGVYAFSSGGLQPIINLSNSLVSLNGNGVKAEGSGALIRIAGSSVVNNNTTGLATVNLGQIASSGDNTVQGNNPDGAPSSTPGRM
ncbi:MAG TPA: right-handed parallel beta-helix repeat-containing protein [Thermoanaerobaculia bacterium]|nr:right-handed parallel beta-helix repeat-containing protein [Thermoanaerobaculia bacterium]